MDSTERFHNIYSDLCPRKIHFPHRLSYPYHHPNPATPLHLRASLPDLQLPRVTKSRTPSARKPTQAAPRCRQWPLPSSFLFRWIQKKKSFKEAVGFLGWTKPAARGRVRSLTEPAVAMRAVYETEAKEMRFEGPLDEALLGLQYLFEALLLRLVPFFRCR
jgi:hypothetical protein